MPNCEFYLVSALTCLLLASPQVGAQKVPVPAVEQTLPATGTLATPAGIPAALAGKGNPADWSDAIPHYNLGNKYMESGRYEEAIDSYHAACARYDFDPDFYINLGFAYRKVKDYQSAEQAFVKALSLNDKDWLTWSNLGNALLKQDKLKETVGAFNRALKCNPPAKDKASLQKDIADINKILAMRGPVRSAPLAKAGVKTFAKAPGKIGGAPLPGGVKRQPAQGDVSGWDEVLK